VLVHGILYFRLNRNIVRVTGFNLLSGLLVITAGVIARRGGALQAGGGELWALYGLWALALVVQVGSPLIVHPRGRFEIQPPHFVERHGALVIVAIGESVAAIGIGARGERIGLPLIIASVLGLALAAVLWWAYFATGDGDRAEETLTRAAGTNRPALALSAFFHPHIPILPGVVLVAAGTTAAIRDSGQAPAAAALSLGGGAALFFGGQAAFRRALRTGPLRPPVACGVFALATTAVGVTVTIEIQLAVLAAGLAAALAAAGRAAAAPAASAAA